MMVEAKEKEIIRKIMSKFNHEQDKIMEKQVNKNNKTTVKHKSKTVLSKTATHQKKKDPTSQVVKSVNEDEMIAQILGEENPEFVTVGCKIPDGIVVRVGSSTILLRGIHDMPGSCGLRSHNEIGFTKVQKNIWDNFVQNHQDWPPLVNGTVFVSQSKDV